MGAHPPALTPQQKRQYKMLKKRVVIATGMKLSRPDHAWTPDPRNRMYCNKCSTNSPFRMEMAVHLYLVKEWP